MEMAIGAVQLSASSQPVRSASDTGFSDVLTEVRSYTPAPSGDGSGNSPETAEAPQTRINEAEATVEMTYESFSAEFIHSLKEHISCHFLPIECENCKNTEENGKIIDALLKILKKMQKNSEDDKAINLLMELLASMTGSVNINEKNASFELLLVSSETTVTAEITEILRTEQASDMPVVTENAAVYIPAEKMPKETEDAFAAEDTFTAEVKAAEVQLTAGNETATVQTAETVQPLTQAETIPVQPLKADVTPVIADSDTAAVTSETADYEKLAAELLEAAKKDLGLTKTEFKTEMPVTTEAAAETAVRPETERIISFNHKDGTDELNSILGNSDKADESEQIRKIVIPESEMNAALMSDTTQKTEVVAPETGLKAETLLPEQQLSEEILKRPEAINGGRTEFTMELNPESLGKITVKLVSVEGRIDVSITAENDATRQLLEARAENVGAALRQNGVELERYQVVSDREEAGLMQESYDGSSKNPYGRNNEQNNDEEHGDEFLEILRQL